MVHPNVRAEDVKNVVDEKAAKEHKHQVARNRYGKDRTRYMGAPSSTPPPVAGGGGGMGGNGGGGGGA